MTARERPSVHREEAPEGGVHRLHPRRCSVFRSVRPREVARGRGPTKTLLLCFTTGADHKKPRLARAVFRHDARRRVVIGAARGERALVCDALQRVALALRACGAATQGRRRQRARRAAAATFAASSEIVQQAGKQRCVGSDPRACSSWNADPRVCTRGCTPRAGRCPFRRRASARTQCAYAAV